MHAAVLALAALASAPGAGDAALAHREPAPNVLLPTALAVVPGVLVPGLGHLLSGDASTARRLRLLSAGSVAAVVAGGGLLFLSGASDELAPIGLPLVIGGGSIFGLSWLADVLGTARPGGWATPLHDEETLALSLQYGPSGDAFTPVRHLGLVQARWENRLWLMGGWGALAPGTPYGEAHLRAGPKLWSGQYGHLAGMLEASHAHAAGSLTNVEGAVALLELRLDGSLLGPSLRGVQLVERLGGGALLYRFEAGGARNLHGLLVVETGLDVAVTDDFEVGLLYSQRPDARVGELFNHGGSLELSAGVRLLRHVRLVATSHLGTAADILAGVEVSL